MIRSPPRGETWLTSLPLRIGPASVHTRRAPSLSAMKPPLRVPINSSVFIGLCASHTTACLCALGKDSKRALDRCAVTASPGSAAPLKCVNASVYYEHRETRKRHCSSTRHLRSERTSAGTSRPDSTPSRPATLLRPTERHKRILRGPLASPAVKASPDASHLARASPLCTRRHIE